MWQELQELKQLVTQLATQAPIGYSTVSEGALRIISAEGLIVEGSARVDGTLIVTGEERVDGVLRITGTLIVSGDFNLSGTTTISGPTMITGQFTVDGDTNITGNIEISGNLDLTGDTNLRGGLTVDEDGFIQIGATRISGSSSGLIESLIEVLFSTPLLRVAGAIHAEQGAILEGSVSMPNLVPIAQSSVPGSFLGATFRDGSGVMRVIVGG